MKEEKRSAEENGPGALIKRRLSELGMRQSELSYLTGITRPIVSNIIKGTRDVTPEMAALIETSIGLSARELLVCQAERRLGKANASARVKARRELIETWCILRELADVELLERYGIATGALEKDCSRALELFGCGTVDDLLALHKRESGMQWWAQSTEAGADTRSLFTWKHWCERTLEAREILAMWEPERIGELSKEISFADPSAALTTSSSVTTRQCSSELDTALAAPSVRKRASSSLHSLAREVHVALRENENTMERLREILAAKGIGLLWTESPGKAVASMSWRAGGKAYMAMTLGERGIGDVARSVMLEIGHLLCSEASEEFHMSMTKARERSLRGRSSAHPTTEEPEGEAERWAREALIPEADWKAFMTETADVSETTIHPHIEAFSERLGIHPQIALERYMEERGVWNIRQPWDDRIH